MSQLRTIFEEMDALVISGKFTEPYIPFDETQDEKIGVVTDPDIKALYTMMDAREKKFRASLGGTMKKLARAVATSFKNRTVPDISALKEEAAAEAEIDVFLQEQFNVELALAFPERANTLAGLRVGWIVATPKPVQSFREALDEALDEACDFPDCPKHGVVVRERMAAAQREKYDESV